MNNKLLNVGDRVQWTSQAGGRHTTKFGIVVASIRAGVQLQEVIDNIESFNDERFRGASKEALRTSYSLTRNHTSYLIEADPPAGSRRKSRIYWPLVSQLQLVPVAAVEAAA